LIENVIRMAIAAAFKDTRFPPLEKNELPQIHIEISILGELEAVQSLDEIQIGVHGIWIKHKNGQGTYLPEVATEQNWSRDQFVMYCAREKAGLSPEACAEAEIFRYEVCKIKE